LHFDKPAPPLPPERGEACSGEELRRISRENVVADELLAAYITLAHVPTQRTIDAPENIAAELERLRILKEHELGEVVEPEPDPYVRRVGADEEQ
jgi:hypothetical protein